LHPRNRLAKQSGAGKMVRLTLIARVFDGLPLAEGLDSEKDPEIDQYKSQAKVAVTRSPLACTSALSTARRATTARRAHGSSSRRAAR
jgi:hypothetical protein